MVEYISLRLSKNVLNRALSVEGAESPPQKDRCSMVWDSNQPFRAGKESSELRTEWIQGKGKSQAICYDLQPCACSRHIFIEIFVFRFDRCLGETPHPISSLSVGHPLPSTSSRNPGPSRHLAQSYQLRRLRSTPSVNGQPGRNQTGL